MTVSTFTGVVNENAVRAAAGLTMVTGAVAFSYAYFDKQYVPLQVVASLFFVEFLIRVTVGLRYSPFGALARAMTLRPQPQWVSATPKRFAWTLGLAMALAMTVITEQRHPRLPAAHDLPRLPDADVAGVGARAVRGLQDLRPAGQARPDCARHRRRVVRRRLLRATCPPGSRTRARTALRPETVLKAAPTPAEAVATVRPTTMAA